MNLVSIVLYVVGSSIKKHTSLCMEKVYVKRLSLRLYANYMPIAMNQSVLFQDECIYYTVFNGIHIYIIKFACSFTKTSFNSDHMNTSDNQNKQIGYFHKILFQINVKCVVITVGFN